MPMLSLVKGGENPQEIVSCPRCDGVTFVDVRHTLHRTGNKVSAGTKAKACALCMTKGEMVYI